jgi:arsenate reductase
MTTTLFHNPRCSKSRATLELLQSKGIELMIIEYLKTPPDAETLKNILKLLGMTPRELMRKNEAAYKEAGLDNTNLSDDELVAAMIEHPILIERPILLANDKAAIGRPPENVLSIL